MKPLALPSTINAQSMVAYAFGFIAIAAVGLLIPILPFVQLAAMVIAVVFLYAGAKWPLPTLMVTLAVLFEAIPLALMGDIGRFSPHEPMIFYLIAVILVRSIIERGSIVPRLVEFGPPMTYLLFCMLASTIYAYFFARNIQLLTDLRLYSMWIILPLIALAVRTANDRKVLLYSIILIAFSVAIIVILQSVLDIRIFAQARVEKLDAEENSDVIRSLAGGATYLISFTIFYFVNLISRKRGSRPWLIFGVAVLIAGLAVTFGRGVWISTFIGLMIAMFINRGIRGVLLTALLTACGIAVMLSIASVVKPRMAEAVIERAAGVGDEYRTGGSFAWRGMENNWARIALEDKPWTGVGLGGEYKKVKTLPSFEPETIYVHNGYVAFAVKMGYPGALFPPFMILAFVIAAIRTVRVADQQTLPLEAAFIGAFIVPVITSYTQPEWVDNQGVAAFSLIIAGFLAFRYGNLKGRENENKKIATT